jgi:hypothetical protein
MKHFAPTPSEIILLFFLFKTTEEEVLPNLG